MEEKINMNYKATERVTEFVFEAPEADCVTRIQMPIELQYYKALRAEYATICTKPIPKINCKAGDVILFTSNITEKILYHDGVYICRKEDDIAAQLGFITWNTYSYTFKPFSNNPPIKCSYMQQKLKILACATGFIRTL